MERQPRVRIMKAKALTNPQPEFVSMVRAGANQEPLRVIKMDTGTNEIVALFEAKELNMPEAVKKAQEAGFDIAQLVFKGGSFTDRAAVDQWLKDGGYEGGYEVAEKKEGDTPVFEVTSTVTTFKSGTMRKVKGQQEGLTVFVGEVEGTKTVEKTEAEVAAEQAAAKPSAITSAKGDNDEAKPDAGAEASTTETTEEAATKEAAKSETVEPPADAKAEAAVDDADKAVATVAKADGMIGEIRQKAMYDVSRLGSVLSDLRWMVADAEYSDLPDDAVSSIKGAAMLLLEALVSAGNQAVEAYVEAFKSEAPVVTTKTDEPAAPAAEATPAPVATMDPALVEVLKGIQGAVETLATTVKAQSEEIAEVKAKAAEAAEEASNKGQTRKGADVVQPAATTEETVAQKKDKDASDHANRRLRSALGSTKGINGF